GTSTGSTDCSQSAASMSRYRCLLTTRPSNGDMSLRLSFIACAADVRSGLNSVERAGNLANAAQRVEIDVEGQARCAERRRLLRPGDAQTAQGGVALPRPPVVSDPLEQSLLEDSHHPKPLGRRQLKVGMFDQEREARAAADVGGVARPAARCGFGCL